MLEVLVEAARLKQVDRAGWVRVGVTPGESVAAHSWGVAWLVLVLAPPGLDRYRALAYAVLHDLAEVRTGDLTPYDAVPDKAARERAAFAGLTGPLNNGELTALFDAYEAQADDEARFVRQCDRLDMAIQALVYAERGADTREFIRSAAAFIDHPALLPLMQAIANR